MARVLALLLVAASSFAATGVDRARAIAVATDYVRSLRTVDVASLSASAQRMTKPPSDALDSVRARLVHRPFWLVSFSPRKSQLGGGYAVYVAADSGEVLGARGYK